MVNNQLTIGEQLEQRLKVVEHQTKTHWAN